MTNYRLRCKCPPPLRIIVEPHDVALERWAAMGYGRPSARHKRKYKHVCSRCGLTKRYTPPPDISRFDWKYPVAEKPAKPPKRLADEVPDDE